MHKHNYFAYPGLRLGDKYRKKISIDVILRFVSDHYELRVDEVKDRNRTPKIIKARSFYYLLAHKYSKTTLTKIGSLVNGKCHSTVSWGLKRARIEMSVNEKLMKEFETLDSKLRYEHYSL